MRHLLSIILILLGLSQPASSQTVDWSYVRTRTMTDSGGTSYLDHYDYDNGLGQPCQQVDAGITPTYKDLVTLTEYDSWRRPIHSWLPAPMSGNGTHQPDGDVQTTARQYYTDQSPYSRTDYLSSPLLQVTQRHLPGDAWYQSGKKLVYDRFKSDNGNNGGNALSIIFYYSYTMFEYNNTSCLVESELDEDGRRTDTYKDLDGRLKAVRQMHGTEVHETVYGYDQMDNLRFVLPPEAVAYYKSNSSYGIGSQDAVMPKYGYEYRYDARHQCIYKKLPGCEPVYYIYDKAGRLIMSQDGVQRAGGKWTFTIPDIFGRTVLTGECQYSGDYSTEPLFDTTVTASRTSVGGTYGYTVSGLQLSNAVVHTVSYYDDYSFIGTDNIPSSLSYASPPDNDCGTQGLSSPKGLLTGTVTARLTGTGVSGYDYSALYYDSRGRVIQTRSTNHLGGYDHVYTGYDFTGNVVKEYHWHQVSGGTARTEEITSTYDHAGRLLSKTHRLDGGSEVTLLSNTYDELGRLSSSTHYGNATTLKTDYAYNVRSWTTSIDNPLFKEYLYYNTSHNGNTPQYGGNVSAMDWQTGSLLRGYTFGYDGFSRLIQANYLEAGNASTKYGTSYTYDKMGNMLSLERNGRLDNNTFGCIDDVSFTYDGNQLVKADDEATDPTYAGAFNFVDGTDTTTEYEYDQNGNMTKDLNKNISSIQYNSLNLPTGITYSNDPNNPVVKKADYTYSASGAKLMTTYTNGATTTNNAYCGNMIYENNVLNQIQVDGGYITFSGSTPVYHCYLKDHLGNNRVVARSDGTVEQVNHYYPFGGLMSESTDGDVQRFKYNGKELDRMHGLDWYDYGARHMDGARGQFTTKDPLCEKYYNISPYAYCANNPINAIDINGDSIYMDQKSIAALINGLKDRERVSLKFNNGILDPSSIIEDAQNSDDFFLKDLYEIASDTRMVELRTSSYNIYKANGKVERDNWIAPNVLDDNDLNDTALSLLKLTNQPIGRHVQGNLGQTLFPNEGYKQSTNGNIQIIINGKGNINAQSIGLAHEFGHVILYMRDLPSGHGQLGVNDFVYERASLMSKRLGYDY